MTCLPTSPDPLCSFGQTSVDKVAARAAEIQRDAEQAVRSERARDEAIMEAITTEIFAEVGRRMGKVDPLTMGEIVAKVLTRMFGRAAKFIVHVEETSVRAEIELPVTDE